MSNEEAPADAVASTLSDMNEALRTLTTKIQDDFATIRATMATKDDFASIRATMATKDDFANMQDTLATKGDVTTITEKLDRLLLATPAAAIPGGGFVYPRPLPRLRKREVGGRFETPLE